MMIFIPCRVIFLWLRHIVHIVMFPQIRLLLTHKPCAALFLGPLLLMILHFSHYQAKTKFGTKFWTKFWPNIQARYKFPTKFFAKFQFATKILAKSQVKTKF